MKHRQSGFTFIEVVIVIGVVAIIGAIGYLFVTRMTGQPQTDQLSTETKKSSPTASNGENTVPEVNSTDDLDTVEKILDQNDPAGGNNDDMSELDAELSTF